MAEVVPYLSDFRAVLLRKFGIEGYKFEMLDHITLAHHHMMVSADLRLFVIDSLKASASWAHQRVGVGCGFGMSVPDAATLSPADRRK